MKHRNPDEVLYAISMTTNEFVGEVDIYSFDEGSVAAVVDVLGHKHFRRVTKDRIGLKVWACDLLGIDLYDTEFETADFNTTTTTIINGLAF